MPGAIANVLDHFGGDRAEKNRFLKEHGYVREGETCSHSSVHQRFLDDLDTSGTPSHGFVQGRVADIERAEGGAASPKPSGQRAEQPGTVVTRARDKVERETPQGAQKEGGAARGGVEEHPTTRHRFAQAAKAAASGAVTLVGGLGTVASGTYGMMPSAETTAGGLATAAGGIANIAGAGMALGGALMPEVGTVTGAMRAGYDMVPAIRVGGSGGLVGPSHRGAQDRSLAYVSHTDELDDDGVSIDRMRHVGAAEPAESRFARRVASDASAGRRGSAPATTHSDLSGHTHSTYVPPAGGAAAAGGAAGGAAAAAGGAAAAGPAAAGPGAAVPLVGFGLLAPGAAAAGPPPPPPAAGPPPPPPAAGPPPPAEIVAREEREMEAVASGTDVLNKAAKMMKELSPEQQVALTDKLEVDPRIQRMVSQGIIQWADLLTRDADNKVIIDQKKIATLVQNLQFRNVENRQQVAQKYSRYVTNTTTPGYKSAPTGTIGGLKIYVGPRYLPGKMRKR